MAPFLTEPMWETGGKGVWESKYVGSKKVGGLYASKMTGVE